MREIIQVPVNKPTKVEQVRSYVEAIDMFLFFVALIVFMGKVLNFDPHANLRQIILLTRNKDRKIKTILDELRFVSKADRVVLALIHNSGLFGFNYHLLKISVLHESLSENVGSLKSKVKDIPLSFLEEEFKLYEEDDTKSFLKTVNEDLKEGCRRHLNVIEVEQVINFLLVYRKTPVGVLAFQYKNKSDFETKQQFIDFMKKKTGKDISFYADKLVDIIEKK